MALPEGLLKKSDRLRMALGTALVPKSYRGRITWGPSGHFPPEALDRNDFTVYDPMNQDPFFFACIQARNDYLSQVPMIIYQDAEPVKPDDSDWKLWNKPNHLMYRSHLMDAQSIYQRTVGSCFMLFDWGQGFARPMPGPPKAVWPFGGNQFRDHKLAGQIVGWSFRHPATAEEIPLLNEQFIRLWQYNWRFPMGERGQSILEPIAQSIAIGHASRVYQYEYIRHYGVPLGALETEQTPGDPWVKQMREGWKKYHDGPRTMGDIAILTGGLKFSQFSATLQDVHPEVLHQAVMEATSAVTGIPPALLGVFRYANYANSEAQIKLFLRRAISSDCSRFAEALNNDYFPRFATRKHCEFDLSIFPEMKMSKLEKAQIAAILLPLGITWRGLENMLQMGIDLDEMGSMADTSFLNMSLLPMGAPEKIVKQLQGQGLGAMFKEQLVRIFSEPGDDLISAVKKSMPVICKDRVHAEARRRSMEMLRAVRPIENETADKVKTWYWKQRQEMLKNLFANAETVAERIPESVRQKYRARLEIAKMSAEAGVKITVDSKDLRTEANEALRLILSELYMSEEIEELVRIISPQASGAMLLGAGITVEELAALGISIATLDPAAGAAKTFLEARGSIISERAGEFFDEVHESLLEGFLGGESTEEIAVRIREISNIGQVRAQVMARTEIVGAANNGRMQSMKDAGVKYKGWAHGSGVSQPRPTHEAADGEVVPEDETFQAPGETVRGGIRWPYDWQRAGAGEWCNCTCTLYTPTYDPRTGHEFTLDELFGEEKAAEYLRKFGSKIKIPISQKTKEPCMA